MEDAVGLDLVLAEPVQVFRLCPDPGDYHLKKGSPCINKGKLTAAQKKVVGKKSLDGKKRIKGKSVNIGCYEY